MATRKVNGDILKECIKNVIGPWKGGLFMPLNMRSHSVNTYAISKLMYRCNIIDPRVEDIASFNTVSKSFVYCDLLEKPEENTLYRKTQDGGLGLVNIQCCAKAALIVTFLQTAINPQFQRNDYHQTLYLHYILNEPIPAPKIPPNFSGDFFQLLRKRKAAKGNIDQSTLKSVYDFLIADTLRVDYQSRCWNGSR